MIKLKDYNKLALVQRQKVRSLKTQLIKEEKKLQHLFLKGRSYAKFKVGDKVLMACGTGFRSRETKLKNPIPAFVSGIAVNFKGDRFDDEGDVIQFSYKLLAMKKDGTPSKRNVEYGWLVSESCLEPYYE